MAERPFGRFFYLSSGLAGLGHEVTLLVASYEKNDADTDLCVAGIRVRSVCVSGGRVDRYLRAASELAREMNPGVVGGLSDTWYALAAQHVARRCGARVWIDAYDNYASYIPWAWPLHMAWRRAARQADVLTVAGPSLADLLGKRRQAPALVLPMAPDPVGFVPGDKPDARARLGLPNDRPLVAFGGGVHPSRDLDTLFQAVKLARRSCPELKLVLSGRRFPGVDVPEDAIWLGYLPDDAMPALYQAVDVVAVMNTPGAFGDYSYPIKLYEAMACGRPVVASRTASTAWILREDPQRLVPPGDPDALAAALLRALSEPSVNYGPQPTWVAGAEALDAAFTGFASR
ncbi:MAG: glycosyltransferase family 4 protein [Pseudomonadota bacterium]|nr:glycosyltransferase family 4 protein [Pseudomonadota bacterium]